MCNTVWETSRTAIVFCTNTYSVPWFFQILGCNKLGVGVSLHNSSFETIGILWFFFPLLVLNVQKHVV